VGAAASPFIGTAGDRFGHKRLLVICLIIYIAGLFGGLFAPDIWILLISRALQGAGIAAFPLGYALIRERFSETEADTGIGIISAMYGAGTFLGVITGSFITGLFSWRMTYMVLIPASCILLLFIVLGIRNDHAKKGHGSLDFAGFFSLLLFLLLFLVFFSLPSEERVSTSGILVLMCAILGMLLFVRMRSGHPIRWPTSG
jgi:MFS family permease